MPPIAPSRTKCPQGTIGRLELTQWGGVSIGVIAVGLFGSMAAAKVVAKALFPVAIVAAAALPTAPPFLVQNTTAS